MQCAIGPCTAHESLKTLCYCKTDCWCKTSKSDILCVTYNSRMFAVVSRILPDIRNKADLQLLHTPAHIAMPLSQSILGSVLVVCPVRCAPREAFLVSGLPGLDAKMSVDLIDPNGGNCRASSAYAGKPVWPCRAAEVLALVGRDLGIVSSADLIECRLSNRPLLGRERLEALPGGEGAALVLGDSSSCFRL